MSVLSFKCLIKMRDRPFRTLFLQHILPTWQQINYASASRLNKAIQVVSRTLFIVASTNIPMNTTNTANHQILRSPQRINIKWSSKGPPKRHWFPFSRMERAQAMFLNRICWMPISTETDPIMIVFLGEGSELSQLQTQFRLARNVYKKKKVCSYFHVC